MFERESPLAMILKQYMHEDRDHSVSGYKAIEHFIVKCIALIEKKNISKLKRKHKK